MELSDKLGNWTTKLGMVMPGVAAMYVKRLLEDPYDRLAETAFFTKLKGLDSREKGAIELVSYILTAIVDLKLPSGGLLQYLFKEVGVDFAPEMAKRMMNGKKIREVLLSIPTDASYGGLLGTLLEIKDDEQLSDLVGWIFNKGPERWAEAVKKMGQLSSSQFARFAELDPTVRQQILEIFSQQASTTESWHDAQLTPVKTESELRTKVRGWTENIQAATKGLKERRR